MKVEYLILIDSEEPFCQSIGSLNSLIQAYDQISIDSDKINYNNSAFAYEVTFDRIGKGHQRYFHIRLSCEKDKDTTSFKELLKLLRTILTKISGRPPEVLWDEIGSAACNEAYPKIHHTENLLRKLITKFMLANVGIGWIKEAIPKEVEDSIKTKQNEKGQNYLHELDFIQLSNLLFKEYSTGDIRKITEAIEQAQSIDGLNLTELKELVPISNWQRYFAPVVECESSYLKKRWDRLYELRCKVAHNRFITSDELAEINVITTEVNDKFRKALENLDKVEVTEEQKEEVAINMATTSNELFALFFQRWDEIHIALRDIGEIVASNSEERSKLKGHNNWRTLINFASRKGPLDRTLKKKLTELNQFRNAIVHNTDAIFTKSSIYERIALMDEILDSLFETREGIMIARARQLEAL